VEITDYRLRKLVAPADREIGDSQIDPIDTLELVHLEVETSTGEWGTGFDLYNYNHPETIPVEAARTAFRPIGESLRGESPFARLNRRGRPRGHNRGIGGGFERCVDLALWDLCGKHLDMPVYELMGGTDPQVPAYASALAYAHDDATTRSIYERFRKLGFDTAKVKIGYPTVAADIDRLRLVRDVLGTDATLMADANEAFSPKEAVRRVRAYREAGIDLYWLEDPVPRNDVAGLRRVAEGLPNTHVNASDYLGGAAQAELFERDAVDIANVSGFTGGRETATVARHHGVPLAVGNMPADVGVHVGAALPGVETVEYSMMGWDDLMAEPVRFEDGQAIAPDRPGHGLRIAETAWEAHEQTAD
jgi:L-alanine-DL-glutamate epimerase-like enolase superfamily enzyme